MMFSDVISMAQGFQTPDFDLSCQKEVKNKLVSPDSSLGAHSGTTSLPAREGILALVSRITASQAIVDISSQIVKNFNSYMNKKTRKCLVPSTYCRVLGDGSRRSHRLTLV